MFCLEAILYHYNELKIIYQVSTSRTRNKSILLPKICKNISSKNSYIIAIKIFNRLPNEYKVFKENLNKKYRKSKMKSWIMENIWEFKILIIECSLLVNDFFVIFYFISNILACKTPGPTHRYYYTSIEIIIATTYVIINW